MGNLMRRTAICLLMLICCLCRGMKRLARHVLNAFQARHDAGSPRCTKSARSSVLYKLKILTLYCDRCLLHRVGQAQCALLSLPTMLAGVAVLRHLRSAAHGSEALLAAACKQSCALAAGNRSHARPTYRGLAPFGPTLPPPVACETTPASLFKI